MCIRYDAKFQAQLLLERVKTASNVHYKEYAAVEEAASHVFELLKKQFIEQYNLQDDTVGGSGGLQVAFTKTQNRSQKATFNATKLKPQIAQSNVIKLQCCKLQSIGKGCCKGLRRDGRVGIWLLIRPVKFIFFHKSFRVVM